MLIRAKTIKGFKLDSLDGDIGKVEQLYFDDRHWTVRYLVANTGSWLAGRQVLISPYALGPAIKDGKHLVVNLTKKQIQDSPSLNSDKPVSRQFEDDYYDYYGWPSYWTGPNVWGTYPYLERDRNKWNVRTKGEKAWDPHLRSTSEVDGYHIQATDGEIGHVEDFIIDDDNWSIRYLLISTKNWWPGNKVLVSPQWIDRVSWSESKVFVSVAREAVMNSPVYSEASLLTREYEMDLYSHYDRQGYWADDLVMK